jgi:hypothetical protein
MDDVQERSPSNISDDGLQGNNVGNQAALPSASIGNGNDNTLVVDNDAQLKSDEEKQADSNEDSDTEHEERDVDDNVQGNDFSNQAAPSSASGGAGNDNTVLVDNEAQENIDEANKTDSNKESNTETEDHSLGSKIFREV